MAVKHPHVFAEIDYAVINKIDLASVMDLDVSKLVADLRTVNPHARIYQTSCKDGTGIPALVEALMGETKGCTNSA